MPYNSECVRMHLFGVFGHICREYDKKDCSFGIIKEENKGIRPNREWLYDIKEWCGSKIVKYIVSRTKR